MTTYLVEIDRRTEDGIVGTRWSVDGIRLRTTHAHHDGVLLSPEDARAIARALAHAVDEVEVLQKQRHLDQITARLTSVDHVTEAGRRHATGSQRPCINRCGLMLLPDEPDVCRLCRDEVVITEFPAPGPR